MFFYFFLCLGAAQSCVPGVEVLLFVNSYWRAECKLFNMTYIPRRPSWLGWIRPQRGPFYIAIGCKVRWFICAPWTPRHEFTEFTSQGSRECLVKSHIVSSPQSVHTQWHFFFFNETQGATACVDFNPSCQLQHWRVGEFTCCGSETDINCVMFLTEYFQSYPSHAHLLSQPEWSLVSYLYLPVSHYRLGLLKRCPIVSQYVPRCPNSPCCTGLYNRIFPKKKKKQKEKLLQTPL